MRQRGKRVLTNGNENVIKLMSFPWQTSPLVNRLNGWRCRCLCPSNIYMSCPQTALCVIDSSDTEHPLFSCCPGPMPLLTIVASSRKQWSLILSTRDDCVLYALAPICLVADMRSSVKAAIEQYSNLLEIGCVGKTVVRNPSLGAKLIQAENRPVTGTKFTYVYKCIYQCNHLFCSGEDSLFWNSEGRVCVFAIEYVVEHRWNRKAKKSSHCYT